MTKHERPQPEARGVVDDPRQDHPTALDRPNQARAERPGKRPPEAAELLEGITLANALRELAATLPILRAALERKPESKPRVEPLVYRADELADALGISRRAIERERSAGRLPRPDLTIGRMPLWRVQTIKAWLERGGK